MLTLDTVGQFTWGFGVYFHIETEEGDFVWSNPEYGGDNTIRPADKYSVWAEKTIPLGYGRDKGTHFIGEYCGNEVKIIQNSN